MASAIIGKLKKGGEVVLAGTDTPVVEIKSKMAEYRTSGIPDDCESVFLSEFSPRNVLRVAKSKPAPVESGDEDKPKRRGRPPKKKAQEE